MRFEDLPKAERDALAEYGYEVAAEMEAMDEPAPGDPTLDPRYDPSRELRRLNYQRHALDREIEAAVAASRGHGQSWNTIGRALGVTAEAARRRYGRQIRTKIRSKLACRGVLLLSGIWRLAISEDFAAYAVI